VISLHHHDHLSMFSSVVLVFFPYPSSFLPAFFSNFLELLLCFSTVFVSFGSFLEGKK